MQIIDNNILVPMIINTKVEINAFVSIIGIIVGGAIAGIAGMFLAIPVLAIIKIVCDRIPSLVPWGYLLGDHVPKKFSWKYAKLAPVIEAVPPQKMEDKDSELSSKIDPNT